MEKVLKQLPISKKALEVRLYTIQTRIKECEGEIPSKFWCDDCKRMMDKIRNLKKKIHNINLAMRTPSGVYTDLGNYLSDGSFSSPTPTIEIKYKCSICGRTWISGQLLGIYQDLNEKVLRCESCNGIVVEIK